MENIWIWIRTNQIEIIFGLLIFCVLLLLLLFLQSRTTRKIKKILKSYESGSLNETLEEEIEVLKKECQGLKEELKEEKHKLNRFMRKEQRAIKKVKLIKYNAFETQGGNVSYALALLNEENTGVIINSIHSTDFSFSYAKEVLKGRVNQVLSKEEESVLQKAIEDRKLQVNKQFNQ